MSVGWYSTRKFSHETERTETTNGCICTLMRGSNSLAPHCGGARPRTPRVSRTSGAGGRLIPGEATRRRRRNYSAQGAVRRCPGRRSHRAPADLGRSAAGRPPRGPRGQGGTGTCAARADTASIVNQTCAFTSGPRRVSVLVHQSRIVCCAPTPDTLTPKPTAIEVSQQILTDQNPLPKQRAKAGQGRVR